MQNMHNIKTKEILGISIYTIDIVVFLTLLKVTLVDAYIHLYCYACIYI